MHKFFDPSIDSTLDIITGSGDIPVTYIGKKIRETVVCLTVLQGLLQGRTLQIYYYINLLAGSDPVVYTQDHMPAKNIVKTYVENGIYHIYTRGVEKRIIFHNTHDYSVLLRILKDALTIPLDKNVDRTVFLQGRTLQSTFKRPVKNFFGAISLLGFCLMPNHIHLVIKQTESRKIKEFMQSILTRYSMYFNKTYKRPGALFQSRYKATLVSEDSYLLALSRYIHRNPLSYTKDLISAYSSYPYYINLKQAPWIDTTIILSYFQSDPITKTKHKDYQSFVQWDEEDESLDSTLTLEEEEE